MKDKEDVKLKNFISCLLENNVSLKRIRYLLRSFCSVMNLHFEKFYKNSYYGLVFDEDVIVHPLGDSAEITFILHYKYVNCAVISQKTIILLRERFIVPVAYRDPDLEIKLEDICLKVYHALLLLCTFGHDSANIDSIMSGNATLEHNPEFPYHGKTLVMLLHEDLDNNLKKKGR